MVGHISLAFSYCRNTFCKLNIVPIFSKKKMLELMLWNDFMKAVDSSKGCSAAKSGADQWEYMGKNMTHCLTQSSLTLLLVVRTEGFIFNNLLFILKLSHMLDLVLCLIIIWSILS